MPSGEARLVRQRDLEFPRALKQISDAPKQLWVRGASLTTMPSMVAIVGSRTPTPYGRSIAEDMAADLASAGICVASGLARGCDGAAHRGALRAGGRTVAVFGTGIDIVHPRVHYELAEEILESGGSLVSEYEAGTPGDKFRFRERNRIISGISLAVIVVQGARGSGALLTAGHAVRQDRVVFGVPGAIDDEKSWGPHQLIKDGARICTRAGDVMAELAGSLPASAPARGGEANATAAQIAMLPDNQQAVLRALSRTPRSFETVAARSGLGAAAAGPLTRLELAGHAIREVNGLWRRP